MALKMNSSLVLLSALCFTSTGAVARDRHAAKSTAEITRELRAFFASQDQANRDGLNTTALSKRFYAEDAVVIGEGDSGPRYGVQGGVVALDDWFAYLGPNGNKGCAFTVHDTAVTSGNLASVFAVLKCKANPPKLTKEETIRQLFVLKRTPEGWRVVREMWQGGDFGK